MAELICKGCGTTGGVDAGIALCTQCIEWGEAILRDCGPRASRMPDCAASIDPAFAHAVASGVPEDALREKGGGR